MSTIYAYMKGGETNNMIIQPLVLTRYLYSKIEVKQSLLISLLNHSCDEALFWAYELYYSGYKEDVFDYLRNLHDWLYYEDNPNVNKYIQRLWEDWIENPSHDWNLGSAVATLCGRHYKLTEFIKTYFSVNTHSADKSLNLTLFVKFSQKDIIAYQTIDTNTISPRLYLKLGCKYAVHKEVNTIFKTDPIQFREEYLNHWEYYSYRCPFWNDKFTEYNGVIMNNDKRTIEFTDDNDMESFYQKWGIEPDEQSLEVQAKSIGMGDEHHLNLIDFCSKYGETLQLQKIKIARKIIYETYLLEQLEHLKTISEALSNM